MADQRRGEAGDDDDPPLVAWLLVVLCSFVLLFCGSAYLLGRVRYVHPRFSVQVQGLEGLDPSPSVASAPAFNLAIHVDNKQHMRRVCWENTAAVMYYNATSVVGWSRLPAFCVGRWSAVDLDVSLPKDGVVLSQGLRDRMVRDRQQGRGTELTVEIKPVDPKDGSRACFHVCDTILADRPTASSPCIPFCGIASVKRDF